MNDPINDIGQDEQELLKDFGTSFDALRAHHADCPKPEILLASQAGVLEGEAAKSVPSHLEKCDFCRILLRDLTDADLVAARPDEERRVRERVLNAARASAKAKKAGSNLLAVWFWKAVPLAAVAAIAVATVIWLRPHQPAAPVTTPPIVAKKPNGSVAPSVFQWEKLSVKLQANSVLVWRGEPRTTQEKYAAELAHALAYYRDDNFAEAAEQLGKVAKSFPRGVEAQLYLGVSQLYLGQNSKAIAPLTAAQQFGPHVFRDDATWYLALAYKRSGKSAQALAELRKLCGGKSNYASRACAGILELAPTEGGSSRR